MANKYNLYKIPLRNKDYLVSKLEFVGLTLAKSRTVSGFQMDFYFSDTPDEIDIWWADLYEDFLDELDAPPQNSVYFATLLIFNEAVCYAVSLGKSHFYLKQFCDASFGLNLAERIIDESNLKVKNSKYFQSKRSKTITSYQDETNFTYDTGESMHYIKAKTIDEEIWGKIASFGTSVQLGLDILPDSLPEKIREIESKLAEDSIIQLPKADLVKDKAQQVELDNRLELAIRHSSDATVEIEEFSVSGIDFIFTDNANYRLFIKNNKNSTLTEVVELTLIELQSFITKYGISNLNSIMLSVEREHGRNYSKPLKQVLEYVDSDRYCLIGGKWHQFNRSYVDYLQREVDMIEIIDQSAYNISSGTTEHDFNTARQENDGYVNVDKDLVVLASRFKVEKMDLFKDSTLFFVKKGTPQKLGYVVDQSINTINLLQNNESNITVNGQDEKITKVCLWLILERTTNISKISELNSIIFLMKLTNWRKKAVDAGYTPQIYITYKR